MANDLRVGAALAALLWIGTAVAQEGRQEPSTVAARLAAAKLAETRGDLAVAESELRAAFAVASGAEKAQAAKSLRDLLLRLGRPLEAEALLAPPAEPTQGGDPIQRLIAVLDSGWASSDTVRDAVRQLGSVGALVVPQLLAALPKLGPFGTGNVLDLLALHDDPRITAVLGKLLADGDPAVAATIALRLADFRPAVAVPLAEQCAQGAGGTEGKVGALRALVKHAPAAAMTQQLARQLAESPGESVSRSLLAAIEKVQQPWVDEVLDGLRQRGPVAQRAEATRLWIARNKQLTEADALRALAALPPADVARLSWDIAGDHREWVRIGIAGARAAREAGVTDFDWGQAASNWEWWRLPDEGGPELLAMPVWSGSSPQRIFQALCELVDRGWQVPAAGDASFAALAMRAGSSDALKRFVKALPVDAEDRAIAIWDNLPAGYAGGFVHAAVQCERPWHRLVARELAKAKASGDVQAGFLNRDWTGAPPEAVAALAALAQKWPKGPSNGQVTWHTQLVIEFLLWRNLPPSVVLPLVEAGNKDAWSALVEREPLVALAHARRAKEIPQHQVVGVMRLLAKAGVADDVPLGLRLLAQCTGEAQQYSSYLEQFFAVNGQGHVDVIRLGCVPIASPQLLHGKVATAAATGARAADLEALLACLPRLQEGCASALAAALAPQIQKEHAPVLVAAAQSLLAKPVPAGGDPSGVAWGSHRALQTIAGMLGQAGDAVAVPVLQRMAEQPELAGLGAAAALQLAGAGRRALLTEMLASPNVHVVLVALVAKELRTDAELRALGRTAVLRLGEQGWDAEPAFAAFDEPDRGALAVAVLADERFPKFSWQVAGAAVSVLGAAKDPALIPQILRGARHPKQQVRCKVAVALGNTFSREAAPHLLEMLKDDSTDVRAAAQRALDEIANYLDARAKWEARLK